MSKLFSGFLIFSITLACAAMDSVGAQPDPSAGILPSAPQPQPVSLTAGFSPKLLYHSMGRDLASGTSATLKPLGGSRITLRLITPVSSKSQKGSSFQARIEGPLSSDGRILLPQGTLFEGHVESKPAKRLMRPGSVYLVFDRLILPDGVAEDVNVHLVSADSRAMKADAEGMLHPTLSKKGLTLQVGGAALTAKLADDLAELIGGTAVGAGSARFIGAGAAGTFLLLQKGREVKLQAGDLLEVEFDSLSQRTSVN